MSENHKRSADGPSVQTLCVRSDLELPSGILGWERELLLPYVLRLLKAVLEEPQTDAEPRDPASSPVRPRIDR